MIAVIDYGVGNLRSVQRGLERAGADVIVTSDPMAIKTANGVVLPGVGAFGEGMAQLEARGLVLPIDEVIAGSKPFLGICLGMQLLFQHSAEMGEHDGLGAFKGSVRRFPDAPGYKVPHMGWNQLRPRGDSTLLAGIPDGAFAYFVHSYYVEPKNPAIVTSTSDHGLAFASAVERGNVYGVQFHPEKSQEVGAAVLRTFVMLCL